MYQLYIANKNYSSWSLRPWLLMQHLGIPFQERLMVFNGASNYEAFRRISPTGRVPCLHDGDQQIWDSMGITLYLAERHPGIWPTDAKARAWAQSACAEMHAGFAHLRAQCSMNIGLRVELFSYPDTLRQDIARIAELWEQGLSTFDGPFLAGAQLSAVDAFYAPIAFRIQSYGLELPPRAQAYAQYLLALPAMQAWEQAALAEVWRDAGHDAEVQQVGRWLQDLRATAP